MDWICLAFLPILYTAGLTTDQPGLHICGYIDDQVHQNHYWRRSGVSVQGRSGSEIMKGWEDEEGRLRKVKRDSPLKKTIETQEGEYLSPQFSSQDQLHQAEQTHCLPVLCQGEQQLLGGDQIIVILSRSGVLAEVTLCSQKTFHLLSFGNH